ncbi:metalloendopeptidase [Entomophthora muscae]|uniref:Metalloendopeptidase n=1 Tax=Entomophthora muscae TaxID=34485 RepID=A0ACC2RRA7_9FUNG|nr:metalloendopeptidase [Entomophthora muscae]
MFLVQQTKAFLSPSTHAIYKLINASKQCVIKPRLNYLNFQSSSSLSLYAARRHIIEQKSALKFKKAAFSSSHPDRAALSSFLPVLIPYASRGALLATPFLYRYGIATRFPRFSSIIIALPVAAFVLLIISSIQKNKYNGRWRLIFLNEQEEYQNSRDDYDALKFSLKLKDGFENTNEFLRVKRVFHELLLATGEFESRSVLQQDWEVMLLDSQDFNARISPSGLLIINSKTLELIESDHELAFILGHELSHVLFRHSSELEKFH